MSKKKAIDYSLSYVHPAKPQYVQINFLDKNNKELRSSVDVVLNSQYLVGEDGDWDHKRLRGFVLTR